MHLSDFLLGEKIFEDIVGGFYFAKNKKTARTFHIRILNENYANQDDLVQAFHRSAEIACSLDLGGTLRALAHGNEHDQHYILVDLKNSYLIPFEKILHEKHILSIDEAISFIENIATILRKAHLAGIIHGNLTPQNIFVNKELRSIAISDFGFGEFVQLLIQKKYPKLLNLLPYYSPELLNNQESLDPRSDIYSMGVLCYRSLVGNLPWKDYNYEDYLDLLHQTSVIPPSLQRLEIPDVLDNIILETLEPKIENRCSNLTLFLQNLNQAKSSIFDSQVSPSSIIAQSKQSSKEYPGLQQPKLSDTKARSPSQKKKILLVPFSILALIVIFVSFIMNFNKKRHPYKLGYQERSFNESAAQNNALESEELEKRLERELALLPATGEDLRKAQEDFLTRDKLVNIFDPKDDLLKMPTESIGKMNTEENSRKPNDLTGSAKSMATLSQQELINEADQVDTLESSVQNKLYSNEFQDFDEFDKMSQPGVVHLKFSVRSGQTPIIQAEIYVDGKLFGKTNNFGQILVSQIQLGKPHIFRIQKNGFEMWAKELTFTQPGFEALGVELQALPAYNPITSNQTNSNLNVGTLTILQSNQQPLQDAFVYINGKLWPGPKNSIPLRIDLPVGKYKVEVKKEGFKSEPSSQSVELKKGENKTLYYYLIPKITFLN